MAKVLLVEDDNNLREIYEARLQAEGYDIVSARDGEEALVVAKAEQPDLVISDVMMPKISGFEMLDILRNTEGLKDVKVIMLTALGQAEDQTRADSLGADRYLVKSQVTLEDIVNAAKQLVTGDSGEAAAPDESPAAQPPVTAEAPAAEPVASTPTPDAEPVAATEPEPTAPVIPLAAPPTEEDTATAVEPQMPPTPVSTMPATDIVDSSDAAGDGQQTNAQEQAAIDQQINDFVQSQPAEPTETPADEPAPNTTPEQEQALNDAVTSLSGGETAPAAETPTASVAQPQTPEEEPATGEEAGTTTHKKVITPISVQESSKKSLDELLAEETAKEAAADSPPMPAAPEVPVEDPTKPIAEASEPAPEQPVSDAQPAAAEQKPGKNDFDPNSIAL